MKGHPHPHSQPNIKRKFVDYRLLVLRTLCKAFKTCKSFIQQKLASKVKKFSGLRASDPSNEKHQKSFAKFEKKLQIIKALDAKAVKAAAFIYAKFDFKLNFDTVKAQVEEVLEQDVDQLVADVFAQFENENTPKQPYLVLYHQMKEKPQKTFKEAKDQSFKLIKQVKDRKEAKKLRSKDRQHRKLEGKTTQDDPEGSQKEASAEEDGGQESEGSDQGSAFEGGQEATDPVSLSNKKKLAAQVDKIIQKNTFFPRDREKPAPKPERVFIAKNDRRKRIQKGRPVPSKAPAPADPGFHPSYLAKAQARKEQSQKKFGGEVVEL